MCCAVLASNTLAVMLWCQISADQVCLDCEAIEDCFDRVPSNM